MSPGFELASTSLAISFSGFCVGWSVFSGIDQNGTEMSVQRLDGWVRRKSPAVVRCQSLGRPFAVVYGATTRRFIFTASTLKVKSRDTVKNQMSSSEQFFQLRAAPRPFSRSQMMRF